KRGFLGHNLPLFLALVALVPLLKRHLAETPEIVCGVVWSLGTWLLYAASSTNGSGLCCSVRWFLPLLVPGYLVLVLALREWPALRIDLLVLSGFGALLTAYLWYLGPWAQPWLAVYWPFQACALLTWLAYRWHNARQGPAMRSLTSH